MISERLRKQIEFLLEADKMKSLYRQSYIINDERRSDSMRDFEGDEGRFKRRENDAEHSFHLALFAMTLAEHANIPVDLLRVMKMVIIHDIVEIDAGDTYCYDNKGYESKRDREVRAAERLFGILPEDQAAEYRALWEEFEARDTAEARFAAALDRMQPMLLNYSKNGLSWREHGISYGQVYDRNKHIAEGSEELWEYMEAVLEDALGRGILKND
ncbi:MAG: HD domain-containing protein [Oscillospiraceae bacterium]|nr:HD domain-containing protein [Oscillospiraceae bacterium]